MMRSAVNIQGLPKAIVPDNRHVIGVAKSIGEDIKEGVNKRRANKLVEEIMAAQNADVPQAVRAQAMPNLDQPQDPQAALQSQIVEAQKQKQVEQAQVQAEKAQKAIVQRSNMQRMLNDPETKAKFIDLMGLDPQKGKALFTAMASADEADRVAVAQEAQREMAFLQNAAYFMQQDVAKKGKGNQFKSFVADAIRQEHAAGRDTARLQELYRANPDEAIALINRNMALNGKIFEIPEVKRMTEKEAADVAIARERLALDTKKHNQDIAEFNHQVTQDNKEQAPDFSDVQSLRKEFAAETKPFVAVNDSYGRVLASAEDPSAAGDLALIFNYMKVLDPGSTVREGEFATAQNAGGVGAKVSGLYNQVINGKRLTESQRADFVSRAGKLYARAEKIHKKRENEYRELAKKRGFDPDEVVFNRSVIEAPNPEADRLKAEAQAAIDAGADPAQVNARLQKMLSGQ